jgi:RNA polymerase sigma-70 factor (ECF subfamily)
MLRRDPLANPEQLIRRVYAYVAYRIGDGPDAEDVTSETFARALRYRDSFDETKGDATSWMIGIARRCIAAHFGERAEITAEVPERAAPGDVADDSARRLDLAGAMATLGDRDRELVALRYGADLTAKQIAELLGLRVNTVEVSLHRVLRRLRDVLEARGGDAEALASPSIGPDFPVRV